VTLTPPGQAFLPEAVAILKRANLGVERARAAATGIIGRLMIGFVDNALWGVLPPVLHRFQIEHPLVKLKLKQMARTVQVDQLRDLTIDIGVLPSSLPPARELDTFVLASSPLLAAMPKEHPLGSHSKVALRNLAQEPFVLSPPRMHNRMLEIVIDGCASAGFIPQISQGAEQLHTMIALTRAGLGITFVPRWVAQTYSTVLSYVPLSDPLPPYELLVVWHRDHSNPAVKQFCAAAAAR